MASRAPRWESQVLPSGATAILAPLPGRSSVSVSLLFGVGSRWEPRQLAGISHFLEHIVFKGTERYRDSRAVASAIEGLGGILNASTEKEMTVFWARVASRHLATAVDVLGELTLAPRIEPEEVDRERQVVGEELKMYLDQPGDLVQMAFDEEVWGAHPLARDPAGNRRSLARIGAEELRAHRGAHYRAERLVVVVSGAFRPPEALRLLRRGLEPGLAGAGRAGPVAGDGGVPGPLEAPRGVRLVRRRGEQLHLMLGTRCSSYLDPQRWILDLLNTVLGEGMSSRLFLELRERRGLAYDVHSFAARNRDSGAFAIYLATRPEQGPTAVRAAAAELARIAEEGVPTEELERAQAQIEGRLALQTESAGGLSEFLGHQQLLQGSLTAPEEVVGRIRAVTEDQVRELAAALSPRRSSWRLAAVGPIPAAGELEAALWE